MHYNFLSKYYIAFPSGVEKAISQILISKDNSIKIEKQLDGGVIFLSKQQFQSFISLPFANNSFLVLDQFQIKENSDNCLGNAIKGLNNSLYKNKIIVPNLKGKSFRIISSYQNTLSKLPPIDHQKMEMLLTKKARGYINRLNPDHEFRILQRSEGIILFMLRLSKNPNQRNSIQKGELSPQIAYIMCQLANIDKQDIILDPFVGYGGIPKILQKYFHYKSSILSDIDKKLTQDIKQIFINDKNISVCQLDACKLDNIKSESIDKIVTDPPRGIFEKIDDMPKFYETFLFEFYRILKHQGRIVLLTAKKELFEDILKNKFKTKFVLEETYHILVSGKKSAIYVLTKN